MRQLLNPAVRHEVSQMLLTEERKRRNLCPRGGRGDILGYEEDRKQVSRMSGKTHRTRGGPGQRWSLSKEAQAWAEEQARVQWHRHGLGGQDEPWVLW